MLRWDGAKDKKAPPLAIVGKGVCFDTGGISLKPPGGMWDMKWDMAGAGIVAGLMRGRWRGGRRWSTAVGLCGLVENMPDGKAQRPGDVVTSMSGQTIEVLNTDAEGRQCWRMSRIDARTPSDRFKPQVLPSISQDAHRRHHPRRGPSITPACSPSTTNSPTSAHGRGQGGHGEHGVFRWARNTIR